MTLLYTKPFPEQGGTYGAEQARLAWTGWLSRGTSYGTRVGGLLYPGDLAVSAGAGMSVNVAAGECLVASTQGGASGMGAYHLANNGAVNLPVAASNATNPRVDSVTATVGDNAYGGTDGQALQVNTGTPTAGATLTNLLGAPTSPANSLLLGYILVPASSSSVTGANVSNRAATVTLQNTASPPPVDAYQAGVLYTASTTNGDGFVASAPTANGGTGAITFQANGGACYIGSPLIRALIPSASQTVTPGTLPTSGNYMAVAIDMVAPSTWGGTVTFTTSSGSSQTSSANALANPAALVAGRVRLLDVVIQNSAGTYSVAATRDRRPWASGAHGFQRRVNVANYTTSSTGYAAIDATNLSMRVECSGAPLRAWLFGAAIAGASSNTLFDLFMDGATVNSETLQGSSSGYSGGALLAVEFTPSAGSHLFVPSWAVTNAGATSTLSTSATNRSATFVLEEILRPSAVNGTA